MKRTIIAFIAIVMTIMTAGAQSANGYFVGKNFVAYNDSLIEGTDPATFEVLGHGFAKDKNHVYKAGKIMQFVDPKTFSIKDDNSAIAERKAEKVTDRKAETAISNADDDNNSIFDRLLGVDDVKSKYSIDGNAVLYNGEVIKKADAKTFKYVGGEYAADKHHAYYKGKILGDAWGVRQFKYQGNGNATDGVHYYSNGSLVDRD